jgi:hypothetical protein
MPLILKIKDVSFAVPVKYSKTKRRLMSLRLTGLDTQGTMKDAL